MVVVETGANAGGNDDGNSMPSDGELKYICRPLLLHEPGRISLLTGSQCFTDIEAILSLSGYYQTGLS